MVLKEGDAGRGEASDDAPFSVHRLQLRSWAMGARMQIEETEETGICTISAFLF